MNFQTTLHGGFILSVCLGLLKGIYLCTTLYIHEALRLFLPNIIYHKEKLPNNVIKMLCEK